MKKRLDLIFPQNLIKEAVIHQMGQKFPVVFNIRRAKVTEQVGEMVLELEGSEKDVENAVSWLREKGLRAEPLTHDTLEG